jgi:hypothetical protein
MPLERAMDQLPLDDIRAMDGEGWFCFLRDRYFRFKYTAPNRYATTTGALRRFVESGHRTANLRILLNIRDRLLEFDPQRIEQGLKIAREIPGLGVAGASGLLAVMYPRSFAIVDQFVVKSLRSIPGLPQAQELNRMTAANLSLRHGTFLIERMREKATALNSRFRTDFWTPRRVDMVLWSHRQPSPGGAASRCRSTVI